LTQAFPASALLLPARSKDIQILAETMPEIKLEMETTIEIEKKTETATETEEGTRTRIKADAQQHNIHPHHQHQYHPHQQYYISLREENGRDRQLHKKGTLNTNGLFVEKHHRKQNRTSRMPNSSPRSNSVMKTYRPNLVGSRNACSPQIQPIKAAPEKQRDRKDLPVGRRLEPTI
jgi:hypothetical protein